MVYVLSDIHGNNAAFNSILSQINLKPSDTLYILGDVIDPNGLDILLKIIDMDNVKMLLGNHEYLLLKTLTGNDAIMKSWFKRNGEKTYKDFLALSKTKQDKIINFIKGLPLSVEVQVSGKNYLLTHCNGSTTLALRDNVISFERVEPEFEVLGDYTLVYGHTPTKYYQGEINPLQVYYGDKKICIDCGANYPPTHTHVGRLACIRLDDMKVFYSK